MDWTVEQVIALAPDAASAKAGQGLSGARKWVSLGRNDQAIWGLCQGSGKDPYRTGIDLGEPAFKCSCPSRKFPCKHALGLFLLFVGQPSLLKEEQHPDWLGEWLDKRQTQKERKEATPEAVASDPDAQAKKERAKVRRAADRDKKVSAGLADLDLWLRDLVRQGLASPQIRSVRFWESVAGRMVDAQAPGVARMLREMSSLPATGEGWSDRLLERIGSLYLLIRAYQRIDDLPDPLQADVRSAVGWSVREEELLTGDGVRDRWLVLGQRGYEEEQLRVQRTWLWGSRTARPALVLDFAIANRPLDTTFVPGSCFDAELVYHPGSVPLRAAVKQRAVADRIDRAIAFHPDVESFLDAQAEMLAGNPWIETVPAPLDGMTPAGKKGAYVVRDAAGASLPLAPSFRGIWRMLAISGGDALRIFGEWDGRHLLPLGLWSDEGFLSI